MTFTSSQAVIEMNGIRMPLRSVGDLYELEFRQCGTSGGQQAFLSVEDGQLWHRRLGHRNMESIRQLAKLDVGIPSTVSADIGICDPCQVGKQTNASFPSNGKAGRATKPLELVHMEMFSGLSTL